MFLNPISKDEKVGATLLREAFQVGGHDIDILGFSDIGKTPAKTAQSEP